MKTRLLSLALVLALASFTTAATPAPVATATPAAAKAASVVTGDYVEARTASVFAGACHYNGERVTEGRSAVLAWRISGGAFNGVDLAGVKLVAAVSSEDNLAETAAARQSEFIVDAATDQQSAAAVAWVKARLGDRLGSVAAVRRGAIAFKHEADAFTVSAPGFAAMSVKAMPDAACCSQPHLVWYQPLMPIDGRRVGYTESASYAGPIGQTWARSDENSAFYGTFGG